jgi:hypothetical protein
LAKQISYENRADKMTDTNDANDNNNNRDNENKNDIYFRYKLEKIKCQYDQFWKQPNAKDDVEAYLHKDQKHTYCRPDDKKWIKETNKFQYESLLKNDIIFAKNDKALIVANIYSFDVHQNPEKAGMSFIHLLGIPRAQIFNGVSLTPENCDIIKDIIDLFESNWGKEEANQEFRGRVVDHERKKIDDENEQSITRCTKLESDARKLEVSDFSYGLHLYPDQSVPHLHVHIIANPLPMRLYSTKDHDEKTVNAKEVRDFIRSLGEPSSSSETPVSNGGDTDASTTTEGRDQSEVNKTPIDSVVHELDELSI